MDSRDDADSSPMRGSAPRRSLDRRSCALLGACALAIACAAAPGPAQAAELWGAYAGYHFDDFSGDEGYGITWNYPDPESAIGQALKVCRERQPPPPVHTPDQLASGAAPGLRCGDVVFAFSSEGPDPEHVIATPDPAWGQDFEKLTAHRRARCTAVFELSNHPDGYHVLGSNFHNYEGDDRASLEAFGERRYARKDRTPNEPYPNPYRTAFVACNDR